jgi:hypothetical protein
MKVLVYAQLEWTSKISQDACFTTSRRVVHPELGEHCVRLIVADIVRFSSQGTDPGIRRSERGMVRSQKLDSL